MQLLTLYFLHVHNPIVPHGFWTPVLRKSPVKLELSVRPSARLVKFSRNWLIRFFEVRGLRNRYWFLDSRFAKEYYGFSDVRRSVRGSFYSELALRKF